MPRGLIVRIYKRQADIFIYVRNEDKTKSFLKVTGFKPYFYVPDPFGEYTAIDGETVDRIYLDDPAKVPEAREKYSKHYEADIPYTRRFLIDTDIYSCIEYPNKDVVDYRELKPVECNVEPRIWYLDIEVYAEKFPEPEKAEYPVITITVYDSYENKYITWFWHKNIMTPRVKVYKNHYGLWEVRGFPNEQRMLTDFIDTWVTLSPDIVAGWNIKFDIDYLDNRVFRVHQINLVRDFVEPFDLLEGYKKIGPRRRSYRLKDVTVEEGLEPREEAKEAADIIPLYESKPVEVLKYNLRDVWRIVELDKKYEIISYFLELKHTVGLANLEDTFKASVLVDTMLLRLARKEGIVLPSSKESEHKRYRGAIVFQPKKGLLENVAVFDMSRYYPSLIISFNISPEKKWKRQGEIWLFKQDSKGLLPKLCEYLLKKREELESKLQQYDPSSPEYKAIEKKIAAIKGVINSIYGYTGYARSRIYDVDVASTVTALAREGILYVARKAEELGYRVVYGDTDSLFVQTPFNQAIQLAERLTKELRQYFVKKYNLKTEPVLKLKFEKYYKRIFFKEAKKRYAGLLVWKKGKETNELDITGFEAIRSDVAPITAEMQEELFKAILSGATVDEIVKIIDKYAREAKKRPLDDIAIYKGINKPLDQYKSNSPHIRAALYSNMHLGTKFGYGSKVKYVWVKYVKGLPRTNVVAFEDENQIKDKVVIDWQKQLKAIIYDPARNILEPLGINVEKRQGSLSKWL